MGVDNSTGPVGPEAGIGDRIRQVRERLRLSQSQLHIRTTEADPEGKGIARTVLLGYEAGKFRPGARELRILCQTLAVDADWLLLGQSDKGAADLAKASASLSAGIGEPTLANAIQLGLLFLSLKTHERDALATLVHGMLNGRKGVPPPTTLGLLSGWIAIDANERARQLAGLPDLASAIGSRDGRLDVDRLESLIEAYEALDKERQLGEPK